MIKALYEVHGIGLPNKGAELMLAYVVEHMRQLMPEAQFMCTPSDVTSVKTITSMGGRLKLLTDIKGLNVWRLSELAPHKIIDRYGISTEAASRGVLDASGFAYGDYWGAWKVRRAALKAERYRRRGGFYVLLPQAFGPFTDTAVAYWARRLVRASNLVFARDEESQSYLEGLATDHSVGHCTDITVEPLWDDALTVSGTSGTSRTPRALIIPNEKLVDPAGGGYERRAYVAFLASCVQTLEQAGYAVSLLNHEGDGDDSLCRDVLKELDHYVPYVRDLGAVEVKREIGQAGFVVTSRFHGAVSALSQGVPCALLGWSHKYIHLARTFGVDDWCLDAELDKAAQQLTELAPRAPTVADHLDRVLPRLQHQVAECWAAVGEAVARPQGLVE